ncbi:MAG: site-specific DNA-methyltransferase [Ignavibacteriales bacterium]|nr:site-specific DNA-methyltransferase [Ignavibacteriales bacterium]
MTTKRAKPAKAAKTKKAVIYPKVKKQKSTPAIAEPKPVHHAKPVEITISPAKGRPMLTWVGKKPLGLMNAFPAQLVERFEPKAASPVEKSEAWSDWPVQYPKGGLLFHGDNKEVLAHLIANGFRQRVKSIYIDPPFNTGVDYVRKVTLRGKKMEKIAGEEYSFTEQVQYSNSWNLDAYLQFLFQRLQICKEILSDDGIIVIRMDVHFGYYLRMIADEVFGANAFENEIIVNRIKKNVTNKGRRTIPNAVDYLYVYFKSGDAEYKNVLRKLPQKQQGYWHNMDSPEIPGPRSLSLSGKTYYPSPGNHLKFPQAQAEKMWEAGKLRENPRSGNLEYWVEEKDTINLDSDWSDIPGYTFDTGYPTENSEQLLERVIKATSKPGEIVLDFFVGSGTTAAVAQKLGRRYIGCDINRGAIQTTSKRLQTIIVDQIEEQKKKIHQGKLDLGENATEQLIVPAQYSFSAYRVNDYDLYIQHNEAVNLACEHIGITRTKSDNFFDGTRGKSLAKITPFNHPLSPVDLEEIKKELKARPNEDRDVIVVCLGKEHAVDSWLTDWNRLRNSGDVPNKINIIELRTDQKYGKFIKHEPAKVRIKVHRTGDRIKIEIFDFISPTIIERLNQQNGLLQVKIDDWRSMVDCVMIDPNYDGKVFNISLSDVPEKKNDLVSGKYELPAPKGSVKVAIKIIDMLGEEVVEIREI